MNRLMVSIQLAAALCAVLIFNMPIASAVQISFFMPGYEPLVTEISDERNVDVNINVFHSSDDSRWENVEISVNVVGTNPAYEVKSILLYSCKNKSPSACMEDDGIKPVEAVNYLSGEKGTFLWEDVSTGSTGNFLTLVQMEYAGKNIWTGYWDRIERLSINEFVNNRKNIESMSVNLKDGVNRDWAINFLTSYFMIPGNWVESITLETVNSEEVSKIHALSGDKENIADDEMQTKIIASNSLSNFENDYLFIFGNGISVPMTVFNGIPSLCGNGYCDSLVNENPDNCCTDCGCEGEKTCTVTDDYQNGMCHVCG
ncbi:MAG: hypothetical protein JW789_01055, partial [Candidatus Aenigmarchaeota archaeon]|nr:hypothetical protein [Candidatus Aenigmarchaeota archaeon]